MARGRYPVIDGLRVLGSVLRARVFGARFPLTTVWNVTFRCNCQCDYCATGTVPGGELGTDEALQLLDDLARLGTRWLTFSGGDPLVRADIGSLIRRALEKRVHVRISTNGILVPEKIDDLRGVDAVSLSLDGPEDVHDRVRGTGTFRSVLAAIEACTAAGIPMNLKCTLNGHNLAATDELLAMAAGWGLGVMFQPATSWLNFGTEANPVAPDVEQYRRTIQRLIDGKHNGAPILNSLAGLRYLAHWPDPAKIPCLAGVLLW
ncbi:hypothetical protein LCGC14_2411190, partial [marine sediment metagenome]